MKPDIELVNSGSFFTFTPLTARGTTWLTEATSNEPWQWIGPSLAVDRRYARELEDHAIDDGLLVEEI